MADGRQPYRVSFGEAGEKTNMFISRMKYPI